MQQFLTVELQMESGYRNLDQREREILLKLLERDFKGRDALLTQIDWTLAEDRIPGEFVSLHCTGGQLGPKGAYPVSEASCHDMDGTPMSVLLHVKDGFLSVLETLRYGDGPIQRLPQASDLEVPPAF
jgi:hypothetical protein